MRILSVDPGQGFDAISMLENAYRVCSISSGHTISRNGVDICVQATEQYSAIGQTCIAYEIEYAQFVPAISSVRSIDQVGLSGCSQTVIWITAVSRFSPIYYIRTDDGTRTIALSRAFSFANASTQFQAAGYLEAIASTFFVGIVQAYIWGMLKEL